MQRRESFGRILWAVEAGLVSWFFFQALRYLLGGLYAHVSSASIVLRLGPSAGGVEPATVQMEIIIVGVALLAPLLAFLVARRPITFAIMAAVVAVGRVFMTLDDPLLSVVGAAVTVAGASLYFAALARQEPMRFAVVLTMGLMLDQIVRAMGQTFDFTWQETFLPVQTTLSVVLFGAAGFRTVFKGGAVRAAGGYSGISLFGGLAFGTFLFLQTTVFSLPNVVARWSGVDYIFIAPWLVAATGLALVPEVREIARRILTLVDAQWRGWFWLMVAVLLVVIGNRFTGIGAAVALIIAQVVVILSAWWIVKPVPKEHRDLTGLALILSYVVLIVLTAADFFTYEYAFVSDLGGGLDWLSGLLRALRGVGLAVGLVGVAIGMIPLMDVGRRIPWQRGTRRESISGLAAVFGSAVLVTLVVLPPANYQTEKVDQLRIATYNIHGGYNLYFNYTLAEMADTIWESGADVVLLQEAEAGRQVSFGVDQPLWLARRLGMDVHFFPTNEHVQGLAVLSRVPIALAEGALLTSQGHQTGLQRVQIYPDEGPLDIYNTWLGLRILDIQEQEQDQWRQLDESLRIIATDHPGGVVGRVIYGGTFNNTPDSPLYNRLVEAGFTDPFDGMLPEQSATLVRDDGLQARIDDVWLRNVLPIGRAVLTSDSSDHRLAVVELNLTQ